MAPGQVFQMLQTQTAVLAYNDVFLHDRLHVVRA